MAGRIVVGVTDAPVSRHAIDWALSRAADRGQGVTLMTVVGGAMGVVGEGAVVDARVLEAEEHVANEAEMARARGIDVTTEVVRGNPVEKLVDASASASLIVIGSDYQGPDGGRVRGVHGTRIVAASHCPVVVVPDIELGERSGVLVAVDGSEVSSAAIRFAAVEADRLGEPLIALTVWTPLATPRNVAVYPELYLENLERYSHENLAISLGGLRQDHPDLEIIRRVERGYPSGVINEVAAGARLAVLGTHGRGTIGRFLLGSISHEVLSRLATVTAIVR